ncbi:MAG: hypothetical protein RLZZ271_125 [Pseudomonadota bacterium]|jgi:DUF1365 family protein
MHSAIYSGAVMHRRFRPVAHHLRYRMYSLLLDLDELQEVSRMTWLFSHNRFNLMSLCESDYGDGRATGLKDWVREQLQTADLPHDGRIMLLTMPRILGYAFNPVSVYFCHDQRDQLVALIYEVNNTFGERHSYLLEVNEEAPSSDIHQQCHKQFHVSPFLESNMTYRFTMRAPQAQTREMLFSVQALDAEGRKLVATYRAHRHALTDASLCWHFVTHPLLTLKVITAIHWEALKLWLKGVKVVHKPAPPVHPLTVIRTGNTAS